MTTENKDVNQQGNQQAAPDGGAAAPVVEQTNSALWDELEREEAAAADPDGKASGAIAAAADPDLENLGGADNQGTGSDDALAAGGKADGGKTPAADQGKQPDIWADAKPEQQAAFKAAQEAAQKGEQYRRSTDGRIAALQRKIDQLTRDPAATAAGNKGKQANAEELLNDPELVKTAKEYPEVAGPFIKIIGKLQEQLTGHGKVLSAIGDERRQTALNEQKDYLTKEHSDWEAVATRKEFTPWLDTQPRHIREAFARNADEIVDGQEAADVIGRFKDHLLAQDAKQQGNGGAQQQDNGTQAGNGAGNTKQVLDPKRQRQLDSAASARSRGPGVASGIAEDGDPKTIWRQMDEQEARQARNQA
jgi:hypothetical protein